MRLNGVKEILEHLGYRSRKAWRHLVVEQGLPIYRDPHDLTRVWADSEELDKWDREKCEQPKNGTALRA